ncbi:MAG: PilZ domain-containing protein [Armatimonadetes bacterium]|nr:PilZ domain-containing protein [Armatimonadota bacterium]
MDNKELRKDRIKELLPIEFTFGDIGIPNFKKITLELYCVNISPGGLMALSNISLKEDFNVDIKFEIKNISIKLKAKVIWNKPAKTKIPGLYELGIEFKNIPEKELSLIENYIEEIKFKESNRK